MKNIKSYVTLISVFFGIFIIILLILVSIFLNYKSINQLNEINTESNILNVEINNLNIETFDNAQSNLNTEYYNNIQFLNLTKLTSEQYDNRYSLYTLFDTYTNITKINILSSEFNCIYANLTLNDSINVDYIILFENNKFTRYYTINTWNYYHSDANKG